MGQSLGRDPGSFRSFPQSRAVMRFERDTLVREYDLALLEIELSLITSGETLIMKNNVNSRVVIFFIIKFASEVVYILFL